MSRFRIFNEARRYRDDPQLDHREFLLSQNLTENEFQSLIEQLEPVNVQINTPLSQNAKGIYSHYTEYLANRFGNEVTQGIGNNVIETRKRMTLHKEKDGRAGYGLVMGRIQSGKTAHMIGVSFNSMDPSETDEPYDVVIVLAGLIEDLRIQTTHRFMKIIEGFEGVKPAIMPSLESDLSSTNDVLRNQILNSLNNLSNNKLILVIKKNHLVLETLLEILRNASLTRRRILIIDDESDYASTDTGDYEEVSETGEIFVDDPSETNRILRQLIRHLSTYSADSMYIGYTATPFANLLSPESLHPINSENGLSLFPRDFLHSLTRSDSHLDNQYYFAEPDCPNVITLQDFDGGSEQERQLVGDAICRHIFTDIVKLNREISSHHTTLIHTSREVEEHRRVAGLAKDIIEQMKIPSFTNETCDKLLDLVQDYGLNEQEKNDLVESIENIRNNRRRYLLLLGEIKVIEVNSRVREIDEDSERNLRYEFERTSCLAIGGTRLSRGLTLEGLTTSLFVRTSQVPRYDTMMQMSRWCGYRQNSNEKTYADLVRITTTEEIAGNLRDIAIAEADLRRKIENIPWDETPLEQPEGLWIIETPGMSVTSEEKMQHIRRRTWGRMGTLPIFSYKSPVLRSTEPSLVSSSLYNRTRIFIEDISAFGSSPPPSGASNFTLFRDIPSDWVLDYFNYYRQMYSVDDDSRTVNNLDRLIDQQYWENTDWTIAVHTPTREKISIIGGIEIGLVNRSKRSNYQFAAIASNGGTDTSIDLEQYDVREKPLLLLYLIDPESTQLNQGVERVFHNSVVDPVPVWGVCLPQAVIEEGGSEVRGGL